MDFTFGVINILRNGINAGPMCWISFKITNCTNNIIRVTNSNLNTSFNACKWYKYPDRNHNIESGINGIIINPDETNTTIGCCGRSGATEMSEGTIILGESNTRNYVKIKWSLAIGGGSIWYNVENLNDGITIHHCVTNGINYEDNISDNNSKALGQVEITISGSYNNNTNEASTPTNMTINNFTNSQITGTLGSGSKYKESKIYNLIN